MIDKYALQMEDISEGQLEPAPQYSHYSELILTGCQHIYTSEFASMEYLDEHFHQILNIMLDGIETQQVQNSIVYVHFTDGEVVKLSIFDYWFNLIFWGLPVQAGHDIDSRYLWFAEDITQDDISEYINEKFLAIDRMNFSNMQINNMIDEVMWKFQYIDKFSMFLYNTANNEDTIMLMQKDPEFYDAMHCDLSQVPIEDVKDVGMQHTMKGIERIIADGTHWAVPYFKSGQGINTKQWKEVITNIGTVSTGKGTVFDKIINSSYINRGLTDPVDYIIEAYKSRQAQIITHENVSESGAFARILNLNNMDERLHPDPNYVCNCNPSNLTRVHIKNKKVLNMYKNRYFRFQPDGIEYMISQNPTKYDTELIGQTIMVRGPITCASRARGEGVCHRCYGGLARTNQDINIGRIAGETTSQEITQKSLSAKHLLETFIKKLGWCKAFELFFGVFFNSIRLGNEDRDYSNYKIMINTDSIMSDGDDDPEYGDSMFNRYITTFTVIDSTTGEEYPIYTTDEDAMYISVEFGDLIDNATQDDQGNVYIDMSRLKDMNLFFVKVSNTELAEILDRIQGTLNRKSDINKLKTKEAVLEALLDGVVESGLHVDAIHLEVILSHQCVSDVSNILEPEWEYPNATYKMVTLNERLRDNPSVTVSLMFKDINKLLFYPLTFMKTKPSVIDLFFMKTPQNYMSMKPTESKIREEDDSNIYKSPFKRIRKPE